MSFGPPGVGKSHLVSALGHALIDAGRRVLTAKVLAAAAAIAPHLECIRVCVASEILRNVYVAALTAKGLSVSEPVSASV